MALEAISSNEPFNFIIYDTICATPYSGQESQAAAETSFLLENCGGTTSTPSMKAAAQDQYQRGSAALESCTTLGSRNRSLTSVTQQQGRKKRKRKPRVCKNKEEAETQRMTHIAVERNRRKQMNEHLAILRSLMPESYAQRVLPYTLHLPLKWCQFFFISFCFLCLFIFVFVFVFCFFLYISLQSPQSCSTK